MRYIQIIFFLNQTIDSALNFTCVALLYFKEFNAAKRITKP